MINYYPRPGSIGERSIVYLREHGKTLGHDLADAIDAERSAITASLNLCVENNLLVRGTTPGQGTWYAIPGDERDREPQKFSDAIAASDPVNISGARIGDTPIQRVKVEEQQKDPPALEVVTRVDCPEVVPPTTAVLVEPVVVEGAAADAAPGEPRHFEIGLFTDGRMVIEQHNDDFIDVLTLNRAETEKLFAWVRKIDSCQASD